MQPAAFCSPERYFFFGCCKTTSCCCICGKMCTILFRAHIQSTVYFNLGEGNGSKNTITLFLNLTASITNLFEKLVSNMHLKQLLFVKRYGPLCSKLTLS